MNIDTIYSKTKFICRKNQLGSLPPAEFEYAFNTASMNYFDTLVGRVEQYQYGRAVPRIGLSMTDNVVSRLMPFQKSATITVASGLASKPTDFNKLLAMYTPNNFRLYRVEENTFAERMQDSIDPIDEANAFYVEQNTNWRVYPTTTATVNLKYLFLPIDVKWAYTLDGSNRPVYNPTGSVDPAWKDNDIDEIIARAVKIIGTSLKEPTLTQFAQGVINAGE